jgi:hypothetical protein
MKVRQSNIRMLKLEREGVGRISAVLLVFLSLPVRRLMESSDGLGMKQGRKSNCEIRMRTYDLATGDCGFVNCHY